MIWFDCIKSYVVSMSTKFDTIKLFNEIIRFGSMYELSFKVLIHPLNRTKQNY
jgi:hypothetical protein